MKKLLLLGCLFLFSCTTVKEPTPENLIREGVALEPWATLTYQFIIIDKCEYILGSDNASYNGGYFLTHKGNCKNPIHAYNKPFGDLYQISLDSIRAQVWREYRTGNPEKIRLEAMRAKAEVEVIKAQVQVLKAKNTLDSIKYYNR